MRPRWTGLVGAEGAEGAQDGEHVGEFAGSGTGSRAVARDVMT